MKKIVTLLFVVLIYSNTTLGQLSTKAVEQNYFTPPSPTAASLGKFGEYPVSLYNGLINIEENLLKINSGNLSLDISLQYNSGGNRVSDIPSWVGLGFSLNAGGVITRNAIDLPDDSPEGIYFHIFEINDNLENGVPSSLFLEGYYERLVDSHRDKYYYNFCGMSGEFYFDDSNHIHFSKYEPFKVKVYFNSFNNQFNAFEITTDDGTKYTFSHPEYSKYNDILNQERQYNSAWYLTKIENIYQDSIILKYITPENNKRYKRSYSELWAYGAYVSTVPKAPILSDKYNVINIQNDELTFLDSIIFNGGKIAFEKTSRNDPAYNRTSVSERGDKKLSSIVLLNDRDEKIKSWNFAYIENLTERLKLSSISLGDKSDSTLGSYSFEYDDLKLPIGVPDPYYSNRVDYWGFYNGAMNADGALPIIYSTYFNDQFTGIYGTADRESNPSTMGAEMLNRITYPTGGYVEFEFESNTYSGQGESLAENPMVNFVDEFYQFEYMEGSFDVDPHTVIFNIPERTAVNFERSANRVGPDCAWLPVGVESPKRDVIVLDSGTYNLAYLFESDDLLLPSNADIHSAVGAVWFKKKIPTDSKIGGGMRIKLIKKFDGININTREFDYSYPNSNISSGYLSMFPVFLTPFSELWPNARGILLTSNPFNYQPAGAPIGYATVKEKLEDSSSIVHHFTTYQDYPDTYGQFHNGYTIELLAPVNSMAHMRGLEVSTDYYNSIGTLVKKTNRYPYVISDADDKISEFLIKPTITRQDNVEPSDPITPTLLISHDIRFHYTYFRTEEEFLFNSDGSESIQQYRTTSFENINHLQPTKIETKRSNGMKEITVITYPSDFQQGTMSFIDSMLSNNILNLPIETVKYTEDNGSVKILSGEINRYDSDRPGIINRVDKLQLSSPVSLSSYKFSNKALGILPFQDNTNNETFSPDNRYRTELLINSYNNNRPSELMNYGSQVKSYIWDSKIAEPIAEVQNAILDEIAYTSFETETKGNWIYSGSRTFMSNSPIGKFCYNLSSGSLSKNGLNTSKKYILMYWANTASANNISGMSATIVKQLNGWHLYKLEFEGISSVTLSGNCLIDEIRLCPSNSIMITYCYEVPVGIKSIVNQDGGAVYYEYDDIGRLMLIRDDNWNVLKKIEYNYAH